MGVFRSEEMLLCQILFSQETVYDCIECLGDMGLVEFRDLNASVTQYQRRYVADIRRCEEMERKLRLLEQEIKKSRTAINECIDVPPAPGARETLSLESNLETLVGEIENVNRSTKVLKRNLQELIEQYHVVKKAGTCLETTQSFFDEEGNVENVGDRPALQKNMGHLKITTGVVNLEKLRAMEVIIWRLGRGVAYLRFIHVAEPFIDPVTDAKVKKAVFVIVCQGENLNKKILKTCQAFHCHLHFCPTSVEQRKEMEKRAIKSIKDTEKVVQSTLEHRARVLTVAATHIETWKYQVIKLKAIFNIMNMLQLDETNEFQLAEVWLPAKDLHTIKLKINEAAEKADNKNDPIIIILRHKEMPPTFDRTNKFTKGFQNLIDAYGIASYREMNPMPYTIITFPFLFAVMFGDIGHGMILAFFATFLIANEKKIKKKKEQGEIQKIFFEGRYIVLLMGLFSIYTGAVYNDIFSKGLNIFGSAWKMKYNITGDVVHKDMTLDPVVHYSGSPYYFGLDPAWHVAENKIIFLNSLKMKLSIILGVVHMIFGIALGLSNHFYFHDYLSIYTKFIPQIMFFTLLFGYLVILIFIKWIMYGPFKIENKGIHCAPNILITFINMMLFKSEIQKDACPTEMYENQYQIQMVFVLLALVCVPWLLVIRTMGLIGQENSKKKDLGKAESLSLLPGVKSVIHEEKHEPTSEIVIHQGIETIEFVLGSISHTASYLRLWALSLAHAQLSEVLWMMVFSIGLKARGSAASLTLVVIFAFWATFTVAILVVMEGLSAFLHTLRLHWVEFQSKFFSASGRPFRPFSFEKIFQESYQDT